MRRARGGADHHGQVIVPNGRAPVAVFADELGFAVAGEVTKTDQGLMARPKDTVSKIALSLFDCGLR